GVRLCRNVDELAEHTSYLLGGEYIWRSSPRILVEEFAQGPYYGANLMGNELIAVGIADFWPPPNFIFREYTHPAPLTDAEYKRIADVSLSCLQALNLGWGPANIEFRWTQHGPVVIEVNPRLSGGDPTLVQLACGVDLVTEHIKLVIGEEWDLRRRHSQTAAARFLIPDRDGTLDWIDGVSRAAAIPGVAEVKLYVRPKTPIVRKGDYQDSIGYIIACTPSPTRTEAILQQAVDLITWSITP
ncbi:ATP-grasp domain-containing protein, partial [Ensifer sp. BRP08]|nr:ATP-grasp domain-containing protein [Ensifer sp. BRP08]